MFILYPLLVGLALGLLTGGRLGGLAALHIHWANVIVLGLVAQVVLFSDPVASRIGDLGPALYVGSTMVVLLAVIRNGTIPGILLVAAGATSNLLAIVANGGYMPAARSALGALSKPEPTVYSNSAVMPEPALSPLTDIFAMPPCLPGANIFSIGDVLIGIGIAATIVLAMRAPSAVMPGEPDLNGGAPDAIPGPRPVRLRTGPDA